MNAALEAVRAKVIEAVPEIVEAHEACGGRGWYAEGTSARSICACRTGKVDTRPITLADVLRAMGDEPGEEGVVLNTAGDMCVMTLVDGEAMRKAPGTIVRWNLALPLDEQEPEVIEFLAKVLGV